MEALVLPRFLKDVGELLSAEHAVVTASKQGLPLRASYILTNHPGFDKIQGLGASLNYIFVRSLNLVL